MAAKIKTLPEPARVADLGQGPEMGTGNSRVAADIDIFFCDPHAPWQRATNENTVSLVAARWAGPAGWCRPLEVTLENTGRR